jgi:hypothetical protein
MPARSMPAIIAWASSSACGRSQSSRTCHACSGAGLMPHADTQMIRRAAATRIVGWRSQCRRLNPAGRMEETPERDVWKLLIDHHFRDGCE